MQARSKRWANHTAQGLCRLCSKPAIPPTQSCAYHQLRTRLGMIKYKYGLGYADYQEMVENSGGYCYICKQKPKVVGLSSDSSKVSTSLSVDHDWVTGKVRGLLCQHCNQGLGHFKHNKELLAHAMEYL